MPRGQPGDECRRRPMAVRDADAQALGESTATMRSSHVGRSPGFVDETRAARIELELAFESCLALPLDVGPVLLGCVPGLVFA